MSKGYTRAIPYGADDIARDRAVAMSELRTIPPSLPWKHSALVALDRETALSRRGAAADCADPTAEAAMEAGHELGSPPASAE